ncbi:hypothetical protein B9Z55_021665 [Caenorhabditis nigoni]|uniref:Uncharacterized protein n=1 Tax=Caenorhabditis nigoni TaxID=1611254 RepID=A0A2G5TSY7_9PELO|nr:hypothetical protein B9Z55_021665 [Caenorhabditis nigoni]
MRRKIEEQEAERASKYQQKIAQRKMEFEKIQMELEMSNRKDHLDFEERKLLNQMECEKLAEKSKFEQFSKNQEVALEIEIFTKQGLLEMEKIQKSREEAKRQNLEKSENLDRKFLENQRIYENEDIQRKREIDDQKKDIEEKRRKMDQKLEEDLENLRNQEEFRKSQMENEFSRIQKVLEMKICNEIVENNWTNRLNKLRNCFNSKFEKNQISEKMKYLESEKLEMRKIYEETGKTFLLDIEESIEEILEEFRRLEYVLENEPSNKSRIQECSSALSKLTLAIPTLAELKSRYKEDNDF